MKSHVTPIGINSPINKHLTTFVVTFAKQARLYSKLAELWLILIELPGFSLTANSIWALDILGEEGVKVDSSVFPMATSHGGLPQFEIDQPCVVKTATGQVLKEFPLNTRTILGNRMVFSGGGYFRLFPYWLLKKFFTDSAYVLTYFHPRDFDAHQPVLPHLPLSRKFKSYVGLKNAESKLVKLLAEFEFTDIRTAVSTVDWENVKIVEL